MDLGWPNFVMAEDGGAIVGLGQVKPHRDGSRELASIAVVPTRQGQGIGSAVIEALMARETSAVLHLTCRSELQGFYERFGFVRLKAADYTPYFRRTIPIVNIIGRLFGFQILVMRRVPPTPAPRLRPS
jgi:N-acetylglutamate synthase-like GNAT family acetyltransferase